MNTVEIERIKAQQNLRADAMGAQVFEDPYHKYMATRVDGGFLDREPGLSLPQGVKDSLVEIRDRVDQRDIQNAVIFHELSVAHFAIDRAAAMYENGDLTKDEALSQIWAHNQA